MEKVAKVIEEFATFPVIDKLDLLRRTVVCFLTGNEDMHLKNFSLLVVPPRIRLAPAYDMVSTTLAPPRSDRGDGAADPGREDQALPEGPGRLR